MADLTVPGGSYDNEALAKARARIRLEQEQQNKSGIDWGDILSGGARGAMQGFAQTFTVPGPGVQSGEGPVAVPDWLDAMRPGGPTNPTPEPGSMREFVMQEPKTPAGGYSQTIMNMITGDLPALGFGGVGRSIIGDIAGGAASEYLGQRAREGGGNEGLWRALGAVVGGMGTAGMPNPRRGAYRAAKRAAGANYGELPGIPGVMPAVRGPVSPQALEATTGAFYDHLRNLGIRYNPQTWQGTLQRLPDEIRNELHLHSGMNSPADAAFNWIDGELRNAFPGGAFDASSANPGGQFAYLDGVSSRLGQLKRQAMKSDVPGGESANEALANAYGLIKDQVDNYIRNASGNLVYTDRSAPAAIRARGDVYRTAKALALRNIKQRRLSEMLDAAQDYSSGFVAGLNEQINSELKRSQRTRFWTVNERNLLRNITKGNTAIGVLGSFGLDLSRWRAGGIPLISDVAKAGATNTAVGLPAAIAGGNPLMAAMSAPLLLGGTMANAALPAVRRHEMENVMSAVRGGELDRGTIMQNRATVRRRMRQALAASHGVRIPEQQDEGQTVPGGIRG